MSLPISIIGIRHTQACGFGVPQFPFNCQFHSSLLEKEEEKRKQQTLAMAMAAAARARLPSTVSLCSRSLTRVCSSSASASPAPTSGSAKVADRIVKLSAIDPEGRKREVVGLAGQTLLRALANAGLIDPASHRLEEIEACSAECEVSIAQEWLDKLPPRSYDETYVLKRNSRARILNLHSRLGCQVVLTTELQGMVVAVPEPKPWDTP